MSSWTGLVFCFGCERVCGCLECGASQRFECFFGVSDNMTIHTNKDIVNAAARMHEISYSQLIHGLKLANVDINRKMLSEIAISDPKGFTEIVNVAKKALAN